MKKSIYVLLIIIIGGCDSRTKNGNVRDVTTGFKRLQALDVALEPPEPGEWLYEHDEASQTFSEYKKANAGKGNDLKKVIYLQPVGTFTDDQDKIIRYTADYLEIFFDRETTMLPPVSDSIVPPADRRVRDDTDEQLLTDPILDFLERRIPADAIVLMAITSKDLYPAESWNFVFGRARMKKGVAVSSLFRYCTGDNKFNSCLERFIKTSSHEIGHLFSLLHCTHAVCVMNGSNSLLESDSRPNRLCSLCLQKLHWKLNFDLEKRTTSLLNYFAEHGLS